MRRRDALHWMNTRCFFSGCDSKNDGIITVFKNLLEHGTSGTLCCTWYPVRCLVLLCLVSCTFMSCILYLYALHHVPLCLVPCTFMSCIPYLYVLYPVPLCLVSCTFMPCTLYLYVLYPVPLCLVSCTFMSCTLYLTSYLDDPVPCGCLEALSLELVVEDPPERSSLDEIGHDRQLRGSGYRSIHHRNALGFPCGVAGVKKITSSKNSVIISISTQG